MSDFRPGVPSDWFEIEVVSRRVNLLPLQVRELLIDTTVLPAGMAFGLDSVGAWRLDTPFAAHEWYGEPVCANASVLCRPHRLERSCRVEIEVAAWSARSCELRLRPASRHIELWSGRKLRRYFALAHLCADDIVRRLDAAASGRTRRQSFPIGEPTPVLVGGRS